MNDNLRYVVRESGMLYGKGKFSVSSGMCVTWAAIHYWPIVGLYGGN